MKGELVPLALINVMVPDGKTVIHQYKSLPSRYDMYLGGPTDFNISVHIEPLGDYIIAKILVDKE